MSCWMRPLHAASRALAAGDLGVQLTRRDARVGDDARDRGSEVFLAPLRAHLGTAVGHVSETGDADAPHTPLGCPCHAGALTELQRRERDVRALDGAHLARA